jgi:hypothetical protein
MSKRTVKFNKQGISGLPNNKPVVYKIQTGSGTNNYTGIAQRGRVQERIAEHLSGSKAPIPGAKVQIEQMSSIAEARPGKGDPHHFPIQAETQQTGEMITDLPNDLHSLGI